MPHVHSHVDQFDVYNASLRQSFALFKGKSLFTVDAGDLASIYLQSFDDPHERQYHNCSCCKSFLNRFGNLVSIEADGSTKSVLFGLGDVPPQFMAADRALHKAVSAGRVTGVFLSEQAEWGTSQTGKWRHFSVKPAPNQIHKRTLLTAGQKMAEYREGFKTLRQGLAKFDDKTFLAALALLDADALYRSDKFAGTMRKWRDLKVTHGRTGDNLSWLALATHGDGFSHVASSVMGTLLEDIETGLPTADIKRRFDDKVDPLKYMRATVAPKAGNIDQAEKIVAQLGLAASFPRRFVAVDEALSYADWTAKEEHADAGVFTKLKAAPVSAQGVFGNLKASIAQPSNAITWVKFASKILPHAQSMALLVPADPKPYGAMTVAVDPEAPLLFTWGHSACYYKWNAIDPQHFGLTAGAAAPVTAVVPTPMAWGGADTPHIGVFLLLQGAAAGPKAQAGTGLFAELLRPELRQVRSTIQAHSINDTLADAPGPQAAGLVLRRGVPINVTLRVWTHGVAVDHVIDRWE